MKRIIIIAPHPDDQVLGCAGTILKHVQSGDKVFLCIATKPYTPEWSEKFIKERQKEIAKAREILGIEKIYYLNFPTAKLDTVPQKELNDSLLKVLKEVRPAVVYAPFSGDLNKDHRLVLEATLVATRPNGTENVKKILLYETLSETEWGSFFQDFKANVYVDIEKEMKAKIKAMKAFKSEIRKYPHPRSLEMIEILARKRGSEVGLKLAEAFVLLRDIRP